MQLHLVNEVLPAADVMGGDIISLGRDLYYNTRCSNLGEAVEQSRFALVAALKAIEESAR